MGKQLLPTHPPASAQMIQQSATEVGKLVLAICGMLDPEVPLYTVEATGAQVHICNHPFPACLWQPQACWALVLGSRGRLGGGDACIGKQLYLNLPPSPHVRPSR